MEKPKGTTLFAMETEFPQVLDLVKSGLTIVQAVAKRGLARREFYWRMSPAQKCLLKQAKALKSMGNHVAQLGGAKGVVKQYNLLKKTFVEHFIIDPVDEEASDFPTDTID